MDSLTWHHAGALVGVGDDRLARLLAGRQQAALSYAGGDSGTNIGGGPTDGVRSIVVIVMISNLAADIVYAYSNPRIRY